MIDYVRVRDLVSLHELTIVASAFDPDAYDLLDEPAVDTAGPLPPKHHLPDSVADPDDGPAE